MNSFFQIACKHGHYSHPERLEQYLHKYLFKDIDFRGKSLIDIGGGSGLFSYYAAVKGASKAVVMEPEFDGSSSGMIKRFQELNELYGGLNNIELTTSVLEDYDVDNNEFDYILMHNSINHINEDACVTLQQDPVAQETYLNFFRLLRKISKPTTTLIVCDCSRYNFYSKFGLPNPFARTIEWEKHQAPEFWAQMLAEVGFAKRSVQWSSPNTFGKAGRFFLGNRLAAYFLYSHFRLELAAI